MKQEPLMSSTFNSREKMSWRPTDFGLYKEKSNETKCKILKFGTAVFTTMVILLLVLYASFCIVNGTTQNSRPEAQELVLNKPAKSTPFRLTYKGNPPSGFAPNRPSNHRYPDNIQDVIGETNQIVQRYQPNARSGFTDSDPFYLYKPDDPGDINLMATTGFRFSPPAWSNVKSRSVRLQETTKRQEGLTLNVVPNRNGQVYLGNLLQPHLKPRVRLQGEVPKKMVILLNLYPDDVKGSQSKVKVVNRTICGNKICE